MTDTTLAQKHAALILDSLNKLCSQLQEAHQNGVKVEFNLNTAARDGKTTVDNFRIWEEVKMN